MAISKGEKIIHAGRPEWGPGDVIATEGFTHEGRPAQRLTIRFSQAGLKVVNTAFATIKPVPAPRAILGTQSGAASVSCAISPTSRVLVPAPSAGQAPSAAQAELPESPELSEQSMLALREECTDPFAPWDQRVTRTLREFRHFSKPSGWMDWATAQSGLADPLSASNRAQLEQWFERYRLVLTNHLRRLMREKGRGAPCPELSAVQREARSVGASAERALREALAMR